MEHGWPQTETMKTKRGVEGTTVILCLSAWGTPQLFSLAATSLYIPISNAWSIYVQEDVIIFVYVKPPLHCKDNSNVVTYMFFRCNWFIVLMACYWSSTWLFYTLLKVYRVLKCPTVIKELFLPSVVNFTSYIWALLLGAFIFIIVISSG